MTTKARIAALQWFHDRGEIADQEALTEIGLAMMHKLVADEQIQWRGQYFLSLTDKGRQDLHEATK